jgi:cell wall-associated NlpC family hydrolase
MFQRPDLSPYVGLPWRSKGRARDGLDCWGLVQLVYKEKLGIKLPSYTDEYMCATDGEAIQAIVNNAKAQWREVPAAGEGAYDLALIRVMGHERHIGLVVRAGMLLHIEERRTSTIESYHGPMLARRVVGFYRHEFMR